MNIFISYLKNLSNRIASFIGRTKINKISCFCPIFKLSHHFLPLDTKIFVCNFLGRWRFLPLSKRKFTFFAKICTIKVALARYAVN